jgi:MOSC domain-containing protein YiiM
MQGSVEAIYISDTKGRPMSAVETVRALAGRGLEGDRYCRAGEPTAKQGPDREATLIEAEAIEALPRDEEIPFEPGESRRNLVTRGVALNHLVGRDFRVGGVRMRGIRLCEPCKHLQGMTRPGVMKALLHRGGLRAQILDDGPIRVGDEVETLGVVPAGVAS